MPVLILTIESDQSTSDVLDWLLHYKQPFVRINLSTSVAATVGLGEYDRLTLFIEGEALPVDTISSFWYRRGELSFYQHPTPAGRAHQEAQQLAYHLQAENRSLAQYISYVLDGKKSLGSATLSGLNKLIVLQKARQLGLGIPETIITSQREEVLRFRQQYGRIICKPISEGLDAPCEDGFAQIFTEELDAAFVTALPATFAPSLFQQRIARRYELRIFYLNQKCYPMAIISAGFSGEVTDIRKPDAGQVTRNVPFQLPPAIEAKVVSLMTNLRLNSGSIDMALSMAMEYVLFEVNPIGQYSANAAYCNYFLDKKIADFLLHD